MIPRKKTSKKEELSDNELVDVILNKNPKKYGELVERYQKKLFVYLYRLIRSKEEAEDILQDVFVKVFKNLKSYDTKRKFSSWIYRIAHNEAVNRIKRKSFKNFIPWEDVVSTKDKREMSDNREGADDAWIRKEDGDRVNKLMDKLPAKYKEILTLRYYADKSYEEIGKVLGKSVNTVGTLISRAKKKMLSELKKSKNYQEKNSR
jgi:RNA polymerase sigma-70 factor, ECF subfamily